MTTSKFLCTWGHEPFKSSPRPKIVCYSPRKRPEMTKSTSFDDVPIFLYPGHEPLKSSPERKIVCYSPRKWPEMTKSTSFDDVPIFVYTGSRAVEIVSGAKKKPCAIAHENDQKLPNRRVLTMSQFSCTRGRKALKSYPVPKYRLLLPMMTVRNDQIDVFLRRANFRVHGVTSH